LISGDVFSLQRPRNAKSPQALSDIELVVTKWGDKLRLAGAKRLPHRSHSAVMNHGATPGKQQRMRDVAVHGNLGRHLLAQFVHIGAIRQKNSAPFEGPSCDGAGSKIVYPIDRDEAPEREDDRFGP
jgi:hypothetical protein